MAMLPDVAIVDFVEKICQKMDQGQSAKQVRMDLVAKTVGLPVSAASEFLHLMDRGTQYACPDHNVEVLEDLAAGGYN
ncbi:hypothetical protein ACSBOX_03680 [Arthrobacter sp. KN11-1C]|uniref:hypothetical protein n=1 Tax=Arthrobacter sp. KN11-1C TaxID=3445774 RepID=UPI003FA03617